MSGQLEIIINKSIKRANEFRHEYLTLEGILLSMLDDEQVVQAIEDCGGDIQEISQDLNDFIKDETNFSVLNDKQVEELSRNQFVDEELRNLAKESGITYQPEISLSLQRVIQRAAIHVQSSGKKKIRGINLLVAMFQEKDSYALYTLEKQGIERFDIVRHISHGADRPETSEDLETEEASTEEIGGDESNSNSKSKFKFLDQYAINLNQLALKNKIDPLIGREGELKRIVQILCRRRKNNPLLVGEAGVGKTAIAEGLAWSIEEQKVPEVLKGTTVFNLDMGSLLAGAKFRGDFEQRIKGVMKDLEVMGEIGEKPILFIDEIHTVMGAGSTSGGSMDASNLLKPSLSSGALRVLGSTTYEEYRKFIEKDSAFSRRFQKVDIDEPSTEDTYKILQGLKEKFEEHHSVKYSNSILKMAVDLSERYLTDRKNPDKSIDVIDEAGASIQLLPSLKRRNQITKKDIETTISRLAKIPKLNTTGSEKDKLKNLKKNLKMLIYGQDKAIEKVSDAILLNRSGLGAETRPMGSFLFAGPTGVGKTELAKQLARELDSHLERFDMSEYMEKHSVSKLIGAPPGYVGHDQGGLLTDSIKKHPYCVLLLDEIEKAHSDIYNILLQVMDHGSLTDSQGRVTDFRNTVIILTTNAGAKDMEAGLIGLGSHSEGPNLTKRDEAIKNFFTPEFRNRLDSIIHFNKLENHFIISIVEKFLAELEVRLVKKNIELVVSDRAKEWMALEGYDAKMGARPISRLIDNLIKKRLSTEILFGELEKGGRVEIDLDENRQGKEKLAFNFKVKEKV